MTLQLLLSVAAVLFCVGLFGVLSRRNVIVVLLSIELMFNAAHLNLIAFWRFGENPQAISGLVFLLLSLAVSGAEAAIGLALALRIYRHYKSVETSALRELKG